MDLSKFNTADLKVIARFFKIVKNYLKMVRLEKKC